MAVPALLRRILPTALDHDTFTIVSSRPDASFLENTKQIIQTNSEKPVTNGLISPHQERTVAIVDRTANLVDAAQALVAARFAMGGRSPYAPDVVLVNEFAMKPFVEAVIQHASKYLAGENGEARQKLTHRSKGILESSPKDRSIHVLVSGADWGIVEVQDRGSHLLRQKVVEKLFMVHPVTSLDDAIDMNRYSVILTLSLVSMLTMFKFSNSCCSLCLRFSLVC